MSQPESTIEVWRPIKDYEGIYEVSSFGRVRRNAPSPQNQWPDILIRKLSVRKGYSFCGIRKNRKLKNLYVHRAVAEAFLGPCPEGYEVNHIDGNKANPRLDNLEYVTPSQNQLHAIESGLRRRVEGIALVKRKLSDADIPVIRQLLASGVTRAEVARRYQMDWSSIEDIRSGKNWHHIP